MTDPTQAQIEAKVGTGKLIDCYLKPRPEDELMFYGRGDGTIVAYLEGYAIIPREEYTALTAAAQVGEPTKPKQTQDEKAIVRLAETLADRQRKLEALTGVHNFAFEDAEQLIERCAQVAYDFLLDMSDPATALAIRAAIRKLKDAP